MTASARLASSPRRRGPSGVRHKTLGSRFRGNDDIKALNQAVKRNADRFPDDFMFRLTEAEKLVVTHCDHFARLRFSPSLPFAFTEHRALMRGSVLKSPGAVDVSLLVVRAFVQWCEMLATHKDLAAKLDELERRVSRVRRELADNHRIPPDEIVVATGERRGLEKIDADWGMIEARLH